MLQEAVINKLQDMLGDEYRIYSGNAFNTKYTNAKAEDMSWATFEKDKGIIPVIFTLQPASYGATPFLSYNTTYSIAFWTPIEIKTDKFGELIEDAPVDVFSDYKKIKDLLNNTTIILNEEEPQLRAWMTFSELNKETALDRTGTRKRVVLRAGGVINLSTNPLRANDFEVKMGVLVNGTYEYHAIETVTSTQWGNDRDGVATQEVGSLVPNLSGEANNNTLIINYEDYEDDDNPLLEWLRDIAMGLNVNDLYAPVQFFCKGVLKAEWRALVNSSASNQGKMSEQNMTIILQREKE